MTRVNIVLNPEIHKKAKIYSVAHNSTLIHYITEAIKEKLKWEE